MSKREWHSTNRYRLPRKREAYEYALSFTRLNPFYGSQWFIAALIEEIAHQFPDLPARHVRNVALHAIRVQRGKRRKK